MVEDSRLDLLPGGLMLRRLGEIERLVHVRPHVEHARLRLRAGVHRLRRRVVLGFIAALTLLVCADHLADGDSWRWDRWAFLRAAVCALEGLVWNHCRHTDRAVDELVITNPVDRNQSTSTGTASALAPVVGSCS